MDRDVRAAVRVVSCGRVELGTRGCRGAGRVAVKTPGSATDGRYEVEFQLTSQQRPRKRPRYALEELRVFLHQARYTDAVATAQGERFGGMTLHEYWSEPGIESLFERTRALRNPWYRALVEFFFLGMPTTRRLAERRFGRVLPLLLSRDLARTDGDRVWMSGVHVHPLGLLDGGSVFVFADLPYAFDGERVSYLREPTAPASAPTLRLAYQLERIVEELAPVRASLGLDFGAGNGVQSVLLLALDPTLRMVSIEIDPHAMELGQFNSELNGVAGRLRQYDARSGTLEDFLDGERAHFAISNPPFNIVPDEVAEHFTTFGKGGNDGLGVVRLFIEQAARNLVAEGRFHMFCELPFDSDGRSLIERGLSTDVWSVELQRPPGGGGVSHSVYAQLMAAFMRATGSEVDASTVERALERAGVREVHETFVDLRLRAA